MNTFASVVDSSNLSSEYFGEKNGEFRSKKLGTSFDIHTHSTEYYALYLDKLMNGGYKPRLTKTFKQAMNFYLTNLETRFPINVQQVKNQSAQKNCHIVFIPFFYKCPKPTPAETTEFDSLVLSKQEAFQTITDTIIPGYELLLHPLIILGRPDKKDMIMLGVYGILKPKN